MLNGANDCECANYVAAESHLRTDIVLTALNTALAQRRPTAVVHHSDHGCQYTSYAFGKRCQEMGVMPSMGSVGDAYDNAMAESFFATLEKECSIGVASSRRPKPGSRSSSGSRAGTTCIGVTPRSGASHRSNSKGDN